MSDSACDLSFWVRCPVLTPCLTGSGLRGWIINCGSIIGRFYCHSPRAPSTGQIGDGVADQVIGADQSAINSDHRIVRGDDHDDRADDHDHEVIWLDKR